MKKSSRIITATLGIICIILTATLTGTIIQYNSIIQDKELTIDNRTETIVQYNSTIQDKKQTIDDLNQQIEEKNDEISYLDLTIIDRNSQIENITNQKDQIQEWFNNNVTYFNNKIDVLQIQNSTNQRTIEEFEIQNSTNQETIEELQIQNSTNQEIINIMQNRLNTSDQQIDSLIVDKTELENRIDKLESVLTFNTSDLQTFVFHVVGEKEEWINNTDINSIYNELLAISNNTYEIIIFPEVREHQNITAELEWLNNDFMGKQGIPIMYEAFSGSEENLSITKRSLENITTALTTNNIKYLRVAEVRSWYMENNVTFPEEYVIELLEFCRTNNLKIFWTEWKIDYPPEVKVFTYIEKLIEGYEDIVTVSFSTNSGEAQPAVGFLNLDEMFQHLGALIQAWYWDTRYDEDLQNMPESLLALHASVAKSAGAEII